MKNKPQVIDTTGGDADSVKYTVIARDIVNNDDYVIGYDYQLEEILAPMIWGMGDKRDNPAFNKELTRAWHWRDHETADYLMGILGVSIEHFEDFLKRHSGNWTYPNDVMKHQPRNSLSATQE